MVLIHEFGHYCIGRMLNFKITEFSVGFGKALISRKNKRGELISLRLFPLGGYCAFAGEEETDQNNADAFTNQKPWKRILVFLAGVTFNFATAVIFSFILLCTIGYDIPQVTKVQFDATSIENYIDGSLVTNLNNIPDEELLQVGDVIISINNQTIDFAYGKTYNDLINEEIKSLTEWKNSEEADESLFNEYDTFTAIVKRDGEYKEVKLGFYQLQVQAQMKDSDGNIIKDAEGKPILDPNKTEYKYYWSVQASPYVHSITEALERAVPFAFGLSWAVLKSLWLLITFQLPISSIGGPITTITTIASYTQANYMNLLVLIPLISANLAIFNILPIPALDGAHVMFTTIEAIRKKPIKRETENMIHTIGLLVLFGAFILIDILHFLL